MSTNHKILTQKEADRIVALHELWLGSSGESGVRADFSGMTISNLNFSGARLAHADFRNTVANGTNFLGASLVGADMQNASLKNSIFTSANLHRASFKCAFAPGADFRSACLSSADFTCASLNGANLKNAGISHANFSGAHFTKETCLDDVAVDSFTPFFHIQCPEEGSFIGWKYAHFNDCGPSTDGGYCIVKLEICADALRSSATSRKCRCSKAKVLEIQTLDGDVVKNATAYSSFDYDFVYKPGEIVESEFDPNRWKECAAGIHFFITRAEAVNYCLY